MITRNQTIFSIFVTTTIISVAICSWYVTVAKDILRVHELLVTPSRIVALEARIVAMSFGLSGVVLVLVSLAQHNTTRILWIKNVGLTNLSILAIGLFLETKLFVFTGHHLGDAIVWKTLFSGELYKEFHAGRAVVICGVGFIACVLAFPHLLFFAVNRLIITRNYKHLPMASVSIFFTGMLTCFILKEDYGQKNMLSYPSKIIYPKNTAFDKTMGNATCSHRPSLTNTTITPTEKGERVKMKNILLVVIESLRADMLPLMPNWQHLQQQFGTVTSGRHYCGVNITQKSLFTLFYSVNASHYEDYSRFNTISEPLKELRTSKYQLNFWTASNLRLLDDTRFMIDQFDSYYETPGSEAYLNDSILIENVVKRHGEPHYDARRHFDVLFLNSTHFKYDYPPSFERYKPVVLPNLEDFFASNPDKYYTEGLFNRYKNSVVYIDYLIGKLARAYRDELQAGNLVLVITGDHGQEFGEHGLLGHSASNLYNCRTQVPLLVYLPGSPAIRTSCSSALQVMPTVLHYLGLEQNMPGQTEAVPLQESTDPHAEIVANDFHETGKTCLVTPRQKYWLTASRDTIIVTRALTLSDIDTILVWNKPTMDRITTFRNNLQLQ